MKRSTGIAVVTVGVAIVALGISAPFESGGERWWITAIWSALFVLVGGIVTWVGWTKACFDLRPSIARLQSTVLQYWSWIRTKLRLSLAGRVLFTFFLLIGWAVGAAGTVIAFYNVESGSDPDQALPFQIAFSWIVVGLVEVVVLGVVIAVDRGFRGISSRVFHRA